MAIEPMTGGHLFYLEGPLADCTGVLHVAQLASPGSASPRLPRAVSGSRGAPRASPQATDSRITCGGHLSLRPRSQSYRTTSLTRRTVPRRRSRPARRRAALGLPPASVPTLAAAWLLSWRYGSIPAGSRVHGRPGAPLLWRLPWTVRQCQPSPPNSRFVSYLARPDSNCMTGQSVLIDGGMLFT